MKEKMLIAALAACALIATSSCANPDEIGDMRQDDTEEYTSQSNDMPAAQSQSEQSEEADEEQQEQEQQEQEEQERQKEQEEREQEEVPQTFAEEEVDVAVYVKYVKINADGVNIRSGAGTGYSVLGSAEKDTYYAYAGETDGWYKINYLNAVAYVSKTYSQVCEMLASENAAVESVIAEGAKLLGTPYVYGAVRFHDGNGNLNSNFTVAQFDCSSLTQYIFYKGAGVLLNVTTRTQILQGATVSKSDMQRGDLLFFTNAPRYNNEGIERVGHVALYLGGNLILHTSSDYAKIEEISAQRRGYFLQAQRML